MRAAWLFLFVVAGLTSVQARSIRVPVDAATISEALSACADCDTIWVDPGRYREHLDIPDRNLTLLSRYAVSADSQDILGTILDGMNTGTVVKVRSRGANRLTLQGFTLRGGWASRNGSATERYFTGGAVHLEPHARVVLKDCLFTGNNGEFNAMGYCIYSYVVVEGEQRVSAQSIRLERCCFSQNIDSTAAVFGGQNVIAPADSVFLEDLTIYNNAVDGGNAYGLPAHDYTYQNRIRISGVRTTMVDQAGNAFSIFGGGGGGYTEVRDFRLENCTIRGNSICSYTTTDSLLLDGIVVTGNHVLRSSNYSTLFRASGAWLHAQDLRVAENQAAQLLILGLATGIDPDFDRNSLGLVERLTYVDNVVGDTLSTARYGSYQQAVFNNLSVRDSRFERNTSAWAGLLTDEGCASHDLFAFSPPYNPMDPPHQVIEDCLFQDNWVLDGDDYDAILARPGIDVWPVPNHGRVFSYYPEDHGAFTLRRCVFRNNKQPNIAPEWMTEWRTPEVGTTVEISNGGGEGPTLLMEDCLFEGNDDGNLLAGGGFSDVEIRNLIVHGGRSGMAVFGMPLRVHNVLIDSLRQQLSWPDPNRSDTRAVKATSTGDGLVSNLTIVDCDVPSLLSGWGYANVPPTRFRNVLCANNSYSLLTQTYWQPQAVIEYSCLQEEFPGEGNFVATPVFEDGGIPYLLAEDSPGVDAGEPDPSWEDPEDPQSPGWAAWPSRGTVRADVGWLGGPQRPGAEDWVDVSPVPEIPAARPQRARLGAAYPNPFNPRTTFPVTVLRHSLVKLTLHNLLGQEVAVLQNGVLPAGEYRIPFEAGQLASGTYVATLSINFEPGESRAVTLLR